MRTIPTLVLGALGALCVVVVPACDSSADGKKNAKAEASKSAAADKGDAAAKARGGAAGADGGGAAAVGAAAVGAAAVGAKAEADVEVAQEPAADDSGPAVDVEIGVEECDAYIAKMATCFEGEGVPEDVRDAQREGFEQTVKGWTDAIAANPEAKAGLDVGCRAAMDAAKKSYPQCFSDQ